MSKIIKYLFNICTVGVFLMLENSPSSLKSNAAEWYSNLTDKAPPQWINHHNVDTIGQCILGTIILLNVIWIFYKILKSKEEKVTQIANPLEIIFDPTNPAKQFWSIECIKDNDGKVTGHYWEYRVKIFNNSDVTIRNIRVEAESLGHMSCKASNCKFDKKKSETTDLNPKCYELVAVHEWPEPKIQAGMLSGSSGRAAYGPLKITVSADNVPAYTKLFDVDFENEHMLIERTEKLHKADVNNHEKDRMALVDFLEIAINHGANLKEYEKTEEFFQRLKQAAFDGDLIISGRKAEYEILPEFVKTNVIKPIPKSHWEHHNIGWADCFDDKNNLVQDNFSVGTYKYSKPYIYRDLYINTEQGLKWLNYNSYK